MSGCISAEELCGSLHNNGQILEQIEECPQEQWNMCKMPSFMTVDNEAHYMTSEGHCVDAFKLCNMSNNVVEERDLVVCQDLCD